MGVNLTMSRFVATNYDGVICLDCSHLRLAWKRHMQEEASGVADDEDAAGTSPRRELEGGCASSSA